MKRIVFTILVTLVLLSAPLGRPASARDIEGGPSPAEPPAPAGDTAQINPLTGLPVEDPSLLALPPALISVSNFPVSGRPQTGLLTYRSFSRCTSVKG